jgi:hypothetical protein
VQKWLNSTQSPVQSGLCLPERKSGFTMSSRNMRLSDAERNKLCTSFNAWKTIQADFTTV